jgi:hypothetical protein
MARKFKFSLSPKVTDFNITESANGENKLQCVMIKSHTIRRALATYFSIPLPLSVILVILKRPHPVEIHNVGLSIHRRAQPLSFRANKDLAILNGLTC